MFIADFHIHSKYSRATSKMMNLDEISKSARNKGIDLVGTGDFTHFQWLGLLETYLQPVSYGIYQYNQVNFIITGEISCVYSEKGKTRKIHNLIILPNFKSAHLLNTELSKFGNLDADGRPILGISAKELLEIVLDLVPDALFIPAHIWTPHFGILGANSGFDDIYECFGELYRFIYALETGLSSNPPMNWMLSDLDKFLLVSNSDAHSPENLGREVNIFNSSIDYKEIISTIKNKDKNKFLGTIEFFPEEGKYHFDGHRKCNLRISPQESLKNNNICPVCKKQLTIGVLHRVLQLADRQEGFSPQDAFDFKSLVPLTEIIAEAIGRTKKAIEVQKIYQQMVDLFGTEFKILLEVEFSQLSLFHPLIAEGIERVRKGKIKLEPGYDGVYGTIKIFDSYQDSFSQIELF